jgi:outer membrane protein assembly factor BamB
MLVLPAGARADWSTLGGNLARTSAVESPALEPPLNVLWSTTFPVPAGTEERVGWYGPEQNHHYPLYETVSYPVIGNGEIFVGTGDTGVQQHYVLRAFDEYSGRQLWTYEDPESVYNPHLVLDQGRLVVGGLGPEKSLTVFNATTGAVLWSRAGRVEENLEASNGVVYFSECWTGCELMAASDETGKVLWDAKMFSGTSGGPVIGEGHIYMMGSEFFGEHGVSPDGYVFDQATGALLRRYTADGGLADDGSSSNVMLVDGRLWVDEGASFNEYNQEDGYVMSAASGQIEGSWLDTPFNSITLDGENEFALVEHDECEHVEDPIEPNMCFWIFRNATLRAEEGFSKRPLWSFAGDGMLASGPIRVNHDLYVGSESGELYVLDDQTGNVVWSMRMPDGFRPEDYGSIGESGITADGQIVAVPAGDSLTVLSPTSDPTPTAAGQTERGDAPPQEVAPVAGTSTGVAAASETVPAAQARACLLLRKPDLRPSGRRMAVDVTLKCPVGAHVRAALIYRGRAADHASVIAAAARTAAGEDVLLRLEVPRRSLAAVRRRGGRTLELTITSAGAMPTSIGLALPRL